MSAEGSGDHNHNILPIKKKGRRPRLHNYTGGKSRGNRRNEVKVFDENKDEDFCEKDIAAVEDIAVISNEKVEADLIKMTTIDFRNTTSVLAEASSDGDVIDFLIEIFDERR